MAADTTNPIRVLHVEDVPGDRAVVAERLSRGRLASYELSACGTLEEARQALQSQEFDVVLLDLGLPDSNGLESFAAAKETTPKLPFVVLTGLEDEAVGLRAIDEGAQDYLVKDQLAGPLLERSLLFAIHRVRAQNQLESKSREITSLGARLTQSEARLDDVIARLRKKNRPDNPAAPPA